MGISRASGWFRKETDLTPKPHRRLSRFQRSTPIAARDEPVADQRRPNVTVNVLDDLVAGGDGAGSITALAVC
jgi:hypothetical protein